MSIEYTEIDGQIKTPEITLYSLSYCSACNTARELLTGLGYAYRYVQVDLLPREQIREVRKYLQGESAAKVMYPVLDIEGEDKVFGYVRLKWLDKLMGKIPA